MPLVSPTGGGSSLVEIDFVGVDQVTSTTEKINQEVAGVGKTSQEAATTSIGSWTELSSALGIVEQAYTAVAGVVKETFGEFQKYAGEVRDLSLISGTGAEATSRFIQVLDDYQLTAQDAETATKKLKDNGLVPTIETLAKLSDQYLAIQDPAEKMAFIQDNLGRGGAKWVNVLNQGSEALLANADAIDKNLILTDEQIAKYEQERLALDALSDSWEGLKIKVGEFFGEAILNNQANERANEILREQGKAVFTNQYGTQAYKDALQQAREEQEKNAKATQAGTEAYTSQAEQLKAIEQAAKDATRANESYLSSIGNITTEINNYNDKQDDLKQKEAELIDQKQQLIAQGWSAESDKIQEINQKLADNAQAQADNAAAFDLASKTRLLGMLQEQLAVDGLDQRETDFLLSKGEEWGVYSADAVKAMQDAQAEVNNLIDQYNAVPALVSTDVVTNYITNGQPPNLDTSTAASNAPKGTHRAAHASGIYGTIPSSYGNEGFRLGGGDTASGGEGIRITPKGQVGEDINILKQILAAIQSNRTDYRTLARSIREEIQVHP